MERDEQNEIAASVIVGSVNGNGSIFTLLDALAQQTGETPFEVIIADRCTDGTAERIRKEWPEAILIRARADTPLPELRTLALERSVGRIIFVTEDHTVPPPNWIDRFARELDDSPERVAAVGGPVDNLCCHSATDWAAFLCEYSGLLPPQPAGEVSDLPGMNVAYRRDALVQTHRHDLTRGFWESTVHPKLREEGCSFRFLSDVVMDHRKHFAFRYFMSQRYHYSRYYAGERFLRAQWLRRFVFAVLAFGLPPLVLGRMVRNVWPRRSYRAALVRSLPAAIGFAFAWAAGEAVGYLFGPGESLVEIE